MSSQTWNQNKVPLVNRYIDALHNSASPHRPNAMENNGVSTTESNGRPRNSVVPLRRKDSTQDIAGRSNSPGRKKMVSRPTPEELVYSQGQGSQRFPAARPSTSPSSFNFNSPRGNDTGSTVANIFPSNISGNTFSQRSPIRPRESFAPVNPGTFQVIPQTNSIDSNDIDWEDDFSSSSCTENANRSDKITNADSNFSFQGQNPGACKQSNEFYGAQQEDSEESTGSGNEADNLSSSNPNLRSIKDRIKSFQKSIIPTTSNGEQEQNDSDDKENGETRINNDTKQKSPKTFGAISQGANVNTFRSSSGFKSLVSPPPPPPLTITPTPVSSSKKPAVTASFLVAINKYSPRQQQEKMEIQTQKDSKQNLKVMISQRENDEKTPNTCVTPNNQVSSGESLEPNCCMPSPGSSSTLIASWRQREASNVALPLPKFHSSSKKTHNVASSNIHALQSKFVECDTNSEVGSTGSSLTAPPVIKTMRHVSTISLKSLSDAQLDTLSNLIDQQVETRLLHLEAQMEKDFRDKLEKMEARMNIKIKKMIDLISAQK